MLSFNSLDALTEETDSRITLCQLLILAIQQRSLQVRRPSCQAYRSSSPSAREGPTVTYVLLDWSLKVPISQCEGGGVILSKLTGEGEVQIWSVQSSHL